MRRSALLSLALAWITVSTAGTAAHAQGAPPVCGNAVIEAPETCDDGNLLAGDGCSPLCQLENHPPDCSGAGPSLGQLWPPNHKFAPVSVNGVTDADGDPVTITITAIAQDEALDASGSGNTCPDGAGVGSDTASLRAERRGPGDGRVYHVAFTGDDGRGGVCVGAVEVCVRHDQRPGGVCGDQGPLFDSTAGEPDICGGEPCDPDDCVPDPDELAPGSCGGERLPRGVERRIERARDLEVGRGRPALRRRIARLLHRAAASAARAVARDRLSEACGEALVARLAGARICAVCAADD